MIVRIDFIVALFLPFRVMVWDDDAVLTFISRVNPIMLAQRNVSKAYTKPLSPETVRAIVKKYIETQGVLIESPEL